TLNSWRLNRPLIKLKIGAVHPIGSEPSLRVNVMNIGSPSVTITSIFIWTKWREGGKSGRGYDYASTNEGAAIDIEGPSLPFKMEGHHSQNWEFGPDWLNTTLRESIKGGTREMEIEIGMATGKSVKQAVKIDDYFNADEIAHLTSG